MWWGGASTASCIPTWWRSLQFQLFRSCMGTELYVKMTQLWSTRHLFYWMTALLSKPGSLMTFKLPKWPTFGLMRMSGPSWKIELRQRSQSPKALLKKLTLRYGGTWTGTRTCARGSSAQFPIDYRLWLMHEGFRLTKQIIGKWNLKSDQSIDTMN